MKTLEDWKIKEKVHGLVFDTTSSNTEIHKGASTLIEVGIGHELVRIGCRHHIMEVVLGHVFTSLSGATSGPNVGIFKRFQKHWSLIEQVNHSLAEDGLFAPFTGETQTLRQEMIAFYSSAASHQQPREDYLELLRLCLVFLSGESETVIRFRAPGAIHHARWMAKAIYTLKIVLFKDQFRLTPREKDKLTDFALFISLVYGRFWHEAPLAANAPLNDARIIELLRQYPNRTVADAALTAFSRHLWYFSEHLIGLSFFDDRVSADAKRAMAVNLRRPQTSAALKRLNKEEVYTDFTKLEKFVTERTKRLFTLLSNTGEEDAAIFLSKDPEISHEDESYQKLKENVTLMKVVNDSAERGIALIIIYNECLTKDEDHKQFLLRFIERHRRMYPISSKEMLT